MDKSVRKKRRSSPALGDPRLCDELLAERVDGMLRLHVRAPQEKGVAWLLGALLQAGIARETSNCFLVVSEVRCGGDMGARVSWGPENNLPDKAHSKQLPGLSGN